MIQNGFFSLNDEIKNQDLIFDFFKKKNSSFYPKILFPQKNQL